MKYRLVITTDGRPGLLDRTLESFFARVIPRPDEVVLIDDSGDVAYQRYLEALCSDLAREVDARFMVTSHRKRLGFCKTVWDAWVQATIPGVDWVYWMEDDFLHTRGVDLRDLAWVLNRQPQIAQMSMMRQPVNEQEKAAGSLYNLYRDRYDQRGAEASMWLLSRTNFSTTISLMSRRFMTDNPWPAYPSECEGRYSIDLLAKGYEFGVWGIGDEWVEHIGETRIGKGY